MDIGIVRRPWFVPVVGIAALAAQAWLVSPLEMVVFGLPIFVVVLGGARFASMLDDAATPRSAPAVGPVRKAVAVGLIVLLVAGFIYIVWGRIEGSGLVGWLDAVQARHAGRYRERTSFIAALCYLLIAFGLGMTLLLRVGNAPPESARSSR